MHLPEAALKPGRLGRAGRRPGPWVAGANREVAKHDPQPARARRRCSGRAERALEVGVDDHQRGLRRRGRDRRRRRGDRGRAEAGHRRPALALALRRRPRRGRRRSGWRRAGRPARGPDSSTARRRRGRRSPARAAGSRPGGRRRRPGTPRPWARSPTAARSLTPSFSLKRRLRPASRRTRRRTWWRRAWPARRRGPPRRARADRCRPG